MKLADFNYSLDDRLIAKYPPEIRGTTRLLVLNRSSGEITDSLYANLYSHLSKGDLLVVNNTKVIKARLKAKTNDQKDRELLILERHHNPYNKNAFKVMYRGKLSIGQLLSVGDLKLKVIEIGDDGTATNSSEQDVFKLSENYGEVPLPPYLKRDADDNDTLRYQTIVAKDPGSVAAPTASLNLTDELLGNLKNKGINKSELTLHVGIGTFMPIRVDDLTTHKMHQEYFEIPAPTIESIKNAKTNKSRVVAVGTTVTRALEHSADRIINNPNILPISEEADIFIYPGYEFSLVDAMLTNFHAPKSTVLMMAAAFAGWDNLRKAYDHATNEKYKFLSYGDSMLIL